MKILIGYWQSKEGINAKCHNCNVSSTKHPELKKAVAWARRHVKTCSEPGAWMFSETRTEELLTIDIVHL